MLVVTKISVGALDAGGGEVGDNGATLDVGDDLAERE